MKPLKKRDLQSGIANILIKHSESPFQKIGTKIGTSIRNIFDNFGNLFKNEDKMNKSYEDYIGTERELQFKNTNRVANHDAIKGVDTRKNVRSKSIYHSVMPAGESPDILIVENIESFQNNSKQSNKNENYNAGDTMTVINKPIA